MKVKYISTLGLIGVSSIFTVSCTRRLDEFSEYSPEYVLDGDNNLIHDVVFNAISFSDEFSSEFDSLLDVYDSAKEEKFTMEWTSIFIDGRVSYTVDFTKSVNNIVAIEKINIEGDLEDFYIDEINNLLESSDFFKNITDFANLYSTGAEGKTFYKNKLLQYSPIWLKSNAIDLITNSVTSNTLNIIYDYENPPTWTAGTANSIHEMNSVLNFDKLDDWIFNTFWKLDDQISFSTKHDSYEWFDFNDTENDINHINIPFNVFGEEIIVSKNIGSVSKGIAEVEKIYESMSIKTNLSLDEVMRLEDLSDELASNTPYDIDSYYGLTSTFNGDGNILDQLTSKQIMLQRVKIMDTYIKNKFVIELKVKEGSHSGFMRAEFINENW